MNPPPPAAALNETAEWLLSPGSPASAAVHAVSADPCCAQLADLTLIAATNRIVSGGAQSSADAAGAGALLPPQPPPSAPPPSPPKQPTLNL